MKKELPTWILFTVILINTALMLAMVFLSASMTLMGMIMSQEPVTVGLLLFVPLAFIGMGGLSAFLGLFFTWWIFDLYKKGREVKIWKKFIVFLPYVHVTLIFLYFAIL